MSEETKSKKSVLFVCSHNSARSQMAEALLNDLAGDRYEAVSAGIDPGAINPLAIEVMKEIGLDISGNKTKMVFDVYRSGKIFQYIIGVCDNETMENARFSPASTLESIGVFPIRLPLLDRRTKCLKIPAMSEIRSRQ